MMKKDVSASRRSVPLLLLGASVIASAPILVRFSAACGVGLTAIAFWRLFLAVPAAWIWKRAEDAVQHSRSNAQNPERDPSAHRPTPAGFSPYLFLPGVFFAGDLALWHLSIAWTTVANAALLANFAPLFVSLVAWLFFREQLRWFFPAAIVLALGGASLVLRASFGLGTRNLWGDLAGIGTAIFYAGYQLSVKRLRLRYGTGTILLYASMAGAAILFALACAAGDPLLPDSPSGWGFLAGLALVSHIGGQGLIGYAMAHLPASFASVSLLWQPVLAALAGWWIFSEPVGSLLGCGAILLGTVLARLGSAERGEVEGVKSKT